MLTFAEAAPLDPARVGHEAARLARLAPHLARGFVIPAEYEGAFYTDNNLPEQLRTLFRPINPTRVDEDLLDTLCVRAVTLVRTASLLDDAVQRAQRALGNIGLDRGEVHLRRDGAPTAETAHAHPPGNEVLVALKRLWAHDWSTDAVLDRLDTHGSIALDARATLVFAGPPGRVDPDTASRHGLPRVLVNRLGVVGL